LSLERCWRNRDLDEAAGAADATACSRDGYFLSYKICVLSGTTFRGGPYENGTVFELVAPVGKSSYHEKVLWSFNGTDGRAPYTSLILDNAGNLYGTTWGGGPGGYTGEGVVFKVAP
jgi:hypothetical protein